MARFVLAATLLISAMLGYFTLTLGHNWGDDFAQYLMQAQSIIDGGASDFAQSNRFAVDNSTEFIGPCIYSWGFPLCLAPLLSLFGPNLLALKCANLLFFELTLLCLYGLFVRRVGPAASCLLVALLAFNPNLLGFLDNILSDTSFLFFAMLSLLLIDRWVSRAEFLLNRPISQVLLGASLGAAMLLRANGVLLLLVLLVCQLRSAAGWSWKSVLSGVIPYGVCLALKGLAGWLLPDGSAAYAGTAAAQTSWWGIGDNAIYYIGQVSLLFGVFPEKEIVFALSVPFLVLGMKKCWRQDVDWLIFCLANYALYVVWPGRGHLRFSMPMLPFYLYFICQGVSLLWSRCSMPGRREGQTAGKPFSDRADNASSWRTAGVAVAMLLGLSFLGESAYFAWRNMSDARQLEGPYDEDSTEMFAFVREHTPADARLLFFKPRAMRLLTGRRAFASRRPEDLAKVDFLVIHKKLERGNQVRHPDSDLVEHVFENSTFVIYRVRHVAGGYSFCFPSLQTSQSSQSSSFSCFSRSSCQVLMASQVPVPMVTVSETLAPFCLISSFLMSS